MDLHRLRVDGAADRADAAACFPGQLTLRPDLTRAVPAATLAHHGQQLLVGPVR